MNPRWGQRKLRAFPDASLRERGKKAPSEDGRCGEANPELAWQDLLLYRVESSLLFPLFSSEQERAPAACSSLPAALSARGFSAPGQKTICAFGLLCALIILLQPRDGVRRIFVRLTAVANATTGDEIFSGGIRVRGDEECQGAMENFVGFLRVFGEDLCRRLLSSVICFG